MFRCHRPTRIGSAAALLVYNSSKTTAVELVTADGARCCGTD